MIQKTTTISNKLGLHARASAKLTKLAGSFPCEVFMSRGERRVNAKSIMGVMMLAAGIGTEIGIETSGEREEEAMAALVDRAVNGAVQGVMQLAPSRPQTHPARPAGHDQDRTHDQ